MYAEFKYFTFSDLQFDLIQVNLFSKSCMLLYVIKKQQMIFFSQIKSILLQV